MELHQLGQTIRHGRRALGQTQAALAASAGLSRETVNLLENGLVRELGLRKVLRLLDRLGLELSVRAKEPPNKPDYVRMACSVANVSFRRALTEDELVRSLSTGRTRADRRPHLRALFDEAPVPLLCGLAAEASRWIRPDRLHANLRHLAQDVGASRGVGEWLETG